ncbi:hypothetical protein MCOR25_005638 [Pyricularia grisea]|uniref:DUF292-domain-containing protein n=1 Tax=Pyricularia grisea TaxID=148305 RepID=A0A6P8BAY9_PYRGI|nr:uncharacterized protein PgNI_03728 [Pyricularia grisea]KAI6364507.1 hypothetical protein MCOR25_005638 [Pyricularia grisea]TLD12995.1 hypothetical protein PgNI_03728 [Pyricularia grisea]
MAPSASIITKIKVQLKLSIARLRMVQQRDEAASKVQRRAMAQLLDQGKIDSARIRVENIIRSDIQVELYEMLELYCELLLARAGLLDAPTCDPGLEEAAKSVIYAAGKTEIKELQAVRQLLGDKFGKEFVLVATNNSDGKVSEKVVKKLSVTPPREELVAGYLEEIARAYGVNWPRRVEEEEEDEPAFVDDAGEGGGGQAQKADGATADDADNAGLSRVAPTKSAVQPLQVSPPSPSTENIRPKVTLNKMELKPSKRMVDAGLAKKSTAGGASKPIDDIRDGIPNADDLAKRFAALKR